ncbi:MAG: hypothetical protein A2Z25_03645 [Planctomycetes bacterium RBG_16_55_9]|nr:MAG: hypothetical protein A2Z25_03645 [Planctomycetes bacterium RBG_16_55_9]
MKANRITLVFALVLFSAGTTLYANSDSADAQPYIGVLLDPAPLPALLVKHLGLAPDQGIRIMNVHRDSPADKAGLERDDIVIGFQGKEVVDYDTFVKGIHKAGVGTEVSLEIIHLGQRKTVSLTVEALEGEFDLKYPPEPDIVQSWRPGKIFRLRPGEENWMEMLQDRLNTDLDVNIKRFFNELYTYHHSDGEEYTITIEGSPDDDGSTIIVESGEKTYKSTLGQIDKLPEQYRESAGQAVKDARKAAKKRKFDIKTRPESLRMPPEWRPYLDKLRPSFEPGGPMFEKIQKQLKELQQRLDRLEKGREQTPDSEKPKKQKPEDGKKTIKPEKSSQKSV